MILIIKIYDARIPFWTDGFGSIRIYTTIAYSITFLTTQYFYQFKVSYDTSYEASQMFCFD